MRMLSFLIAVAAIWLPVVPSASPLDRIRQDLLAKQRQASPNGVFEIAVEENGVWRVIAERAFSQFYRRQAVALPEATSPLRVRIRQQGGGLAHIDQIDVSGVPAITIQNVSELEARKLAAVDQDVIDATRRTLDIVVPPASGAILSLSARIEPERISPYPFVYPVHADLGHSAEVRSYMIYVPGSRRRTLTVDGDIGEVQKDPPFFSAFWPTGSGHPDGATYGWVYDDGITLYVAIDFTPDNTMDGDKDYAAIVAQTPYGERTFRVSMKERRWGKPGFTYTDRVGYQHKVYEFRIPLAELGVDAEPGWWERFQALLGLRDLQPEPVRFAVLAYGTASASGFMNPDVVYNSNDNEFLGVFEHFVCCNPVEIWAQRYDAQGQAIGNAFPVAVSSGDSTDPRVAYDSINNRYLVVYTRAAASSQVWGRLINADGTFAAPETGIVAVPGQSASQPVVTFSPTSARFGVAYQFASDVSATILDATATRISDVTLVPGANAILLGLMDIAWEPTMDAFSVVYVDGFVDSGGDIASATLFANGAVGAAPFFIGNENLGGYSVLNPAVAADPGRGRLLAVWGDQRDLATEGNNIYGQLYTVTGKTFLSSTTENVLIAGSPYDEGNFGALALGAGRSSVDYDAVRDEFIVSFVSARPTTTEVYYQRLDAATLAPVAATVGANSLAATTVAPAGAEEAHVAVNTICGGFMIVYHEVDDVVFPSAVTVRTSDHVAQPCPPAAPPTTAPPMIAVSAVGGGSSTVFGSVIIGASVTAAIAVTNAGGSDLVIGTVAGNEPLASPFALTGDACSGQTLAAGDGCTLTVSFAPTATGAFSDRFDVPSNDPSATLLLWDVSGTGALPGNNPPPVPELVRPEDGGVVRGNSAEFIWISDPDPDGDALTFELTYCAATDFTGCTPVAVSLPRETAQNKHRQNGGLMWSLLLVGAGMVLMPARRTMMLAVLVVLSAATACETTGAFQLSLGEGQVAYGYVADDLVPGSTYAWKVEAVDDQGARTASETWTFTVE